MPPGCDVTAGVMATSNDVIRTQVVRNYRQFVIGQLDPGRGMPFVYALLALRTSAEICPLLSCRPSCPGNSQLIIILLYASRHFSESTHHTRIAYCATSPVSAIANVELQIIQASGTVILLCRLLMAKSYCVKKVGCIFSFV